jgi:DNA-binding NarL/FixJ family response regulator
MQSVLLLQRDEEASPRLAALIDAAPPFQVAGTAHTVDTARELLAELRPDVLVTDLKVQDGDVHALLRELRQGSHRPHVLVTQVAHDDAALVQALRAGADGYWVHTRSPALLLDTLGQLTRGESPMSPAIARQVLSYFEAAASLAEAGVVVKPPALTRIERETLQWLAKGYLIDEIAQKWESSVHAVARSIRRAYQKLQCELPMGEPSLA